MNKICVLYGGNSSERSVSLKSGKYIYESLIIKGYEASLIDYKHLIDLGELKYFDLVFIALHGEEGESGILQSKLEEAGINYTGSGFKSCKNTWDKENCKNILKQHNLPTPKFFVYETFQEIIESKQQLNQEFKKGAFIDF